MFPGTKRPFVEETPNFFFIKNMERAMRVVLYTGMASLLNVSVCISGWCFRHRSGDHGRSR